MTSLRTLRDPAPEELPADVAGFLRALGGPAAIHVAGRDRDPARRRAAVTLLHGNEPSGVVALHGLLRAGLRPAVDLLLVVAAVETALGPPLFARRQAPEERDLNRCFRPPFEGREAALAGDLLRTLENFHPACLIDVHNNTGRNPPYGVGPRDDPPHRALTALFGSRFVCSDLELGALVEATDPLWPSVTIECGQAGDAEADATASRGLRAYATAEDPLATDASTVRVLFEPRRVRVRDTLRLAFAPRPDPSADLTLRDDLEEHNFERVARGTALGWVREGSEWPLEVRDVHGRDHSRALFALEGGVLRAARAMVPIMVTTRPEIARSDCLFYVVRDPTDEDAVSGSAAQEPA